MVTGWKKAKIGELTDIVNGGTPSTAIAEYWNGGINWCTPSDITKKKTKYLSNTEKTITEKGLSESSASLLPIGTILLCSRATIGEMSIAASEMATNQGFKNLICKKDVDNEFLYYALFPLRNKMLELAIGTTFLEISKSALQSIEVIIPADIIEQTAIAGALSDVDSLISSLQKLIEKKKAIKQGAMQELLTGKKRLPGFYREWRIVQIGETLSIGHGQSQKTVENRFGKYPILATGGCIGYANDFLWDKPSVLIGRKGTIDKPQYADYPFWTIDTLFYTKIFDGYDAKFIYYKFCMIDWQQYNEASGVPSLNATTIENLQIIVPEKDEQQAIAQLLSDIDSEIEQLEKKLVKYQQIKQGMMQELLTGRIRLKEGEKNA